LYSSAYVDCPKSLHCTTDGFIGLPVAVRNPEERTVDPGCFDPPEIYGFPERSRDRLVSMTRDVRGTQLQMTAVRSLCHAPAKLILAAGIESKNDHTSMTISPSRQ
jgi:hypothetical protein